MNLLCTNKFQTWKKEFYFKMNKKKGSESIRNKKKGSESIRNKKKEVNQSGIKKNVTNY